MQAARRHGIGNNFIGAMPVQASVSDLFPTIPIAHR